ncbi:MAG TPA: discoidin domain-containing protein, partial [Armatimonadota bacterium]|nr:discoidin domain-containing protein [Armatimonadota bacterium]
MVSYLFVAGLALTIWASAAMGASAQLICSYEQLREDWLTQQRVRGVASGGLAPTLEEDALGGCDGVKDGRWGFHTDAEPNPWWQVDLGEPTPIARIDVYNRADGAAERAARILCWLSDDGQTWREVYRHNGQVFYGYTDGKPLRIALGGEVARYVRLGLEGTSYLHLDEVEVYRPGDGAPNVALGKVATQSSLSQWSAKHYRTLGDPLTPDALADLVRRGLLLADDLAARGVDVSAARGELQAVAEAVRGLPDDTAYADREALLLRTRAATRSLALANPLLDFDDLLFAKRVPGSFSHMSDQNYGWWSRPGGGLFVLEGFRTDTPQLRCLTEGFAPGTFANPDLSYDGTRVLFAYCRHYADLAAKPDKLDKASIPEDAFYHVYEVGIDGSGLRQLTTGRYDDFDARYLPNGEIVFLSTRRGQFLQCGLESAMATLTAPFPDSFVRCGGDAYRPVSVYTLHVMDADGQRTRAISPFENFEWTPSVAADGRVLYARWDYVDRSNMPYMGLWATTPDGTEPVAVYGNFTPSPHCVFEARPVPGSRKLMFTASAHHCVTGGSVVLLDPARGVDGTEPMVRLTPEVCFPEAEGWPNTYFANPYPLSEEYYLAAWSHVPLVGQGGLQPPNAMGLYLADAFGNLDLLYRDPGISS